MAVDPVAFVNYTTATLSDLFYTGGGVTSGVPGQWDVSLNGRPYMIDWTKARAGEIGHRSTRMLRWQADASNEPGEESLNYDDLWRRSMSSWTHGAGQRFLDKGTLASTSDRLRFDQSKGINVWKDFQFSLLPDTRQIRASGNTNLLTLAVGTRLYVIDGTSIVFTSDITVGSPTWTAVTGYTGAAILTAATDGFTVYFSDGVDVWSTNSGIGTTSKYITAFAVGLLGYVKGRVMAAGLNATKNVLYNITTGAAPPALFTHANTNWSWVGFSEGQTEIYIAGTSGPVSLIYRLPVRPDATALDQPIIAASLPIGETASAIYGYLGGFQMIGTSKGFRFALPGAQGDLKLGAATPDVNASVQIGAAPKTFFGYGRFVYFGWSNYDGASTGLGRADLSQFGVEDRQQLAYASDLMVTGQGAVLSGTVFQDLVLLAVSGLGVYVQDAANLVAAGTLDNGVMDYQLIDPKIALKIAVQFGTSPAFAGTVKAFLAVDESTTFALLGTHADTALDNTADAFPVGARRARKFEVRFELDRSAAAPGTGPTMTHWTLRAQPAPDLTEVLTVPLIISKEAADANGAASTMDPETELAALKLLHDTRVLYTYQELGTVYQCILDEYDWKPSGVVQNTRDGFNGTFVATQKKVV